MVYQTIMMTLALMSIFSIGKWNGAVIIIDRKCLVFRQMIIQLKNNLIQQVDS